MADEADIAQQITEFFTAAALNAATQAVKTPTGVCYNCQDTIEPHKAYCDAKCEKDHARRAQLAGVTR